MPALKFIWKVISSRPLLFAVACGLLWLWWQDWRAFKAVAALRSAHYVAHDTVLSKGLPRTRYICGDAGPVQFVAGKLTDDQIRQLARDHGLELVKTVPGPEREVVKFVTKEGHTVRLFGEKDILPAPWGAKAAGGVDENGAFWLDPKNNPEPYNEKLAIWEWSVSGLYAARSSYGTTQSGAEVGGELGYVWRRTGRFEYGPVARVGYQWGGSGWSGAIGLRVTHRDLPLRLRLSGDQTPP